MSFTNSQLAANQVSQDESNRLPWAVAPAKMKAALAEADQAVNEFHERVTDKQDFEIEASKAIAEWDAKAAENVAAGKGLPDTKAKDLALYKAKAADGEITKAEGKIRGTENALGVLIGDEKLRTEWVDAMEKQLEADQNRLSELSPEVSLLMTRISQLHRYSAWLATYPASGSPDFVTSTGFEAALNEALNTKVKRPATPEAGTIAVTYSEMRERYI